MSNGYCNDEANNKECGFDGGDCCGPCINTDYCSNCSCIGHFDGDVVYNPLLGDGFCNDETNNAACDYDYGDCCLTNVKTDYCSDCLCSRNGFIIVLRQNFLHVNVNMTWLIQLPIGLHIKIDFLTFYIYWK